MVKKLSFLLLVLTLVGLLVFGYFFLVTKSNHFVTNFIKTNLTQNISIGYVGIDYPFKIALRDVKIFIQEGDEKKDIIRIEKIYIYPYPTISFKNRLLISKVDILNPEVIVTREVSGGFRLPIHNGLLKGQAAKNLFISRIDLENGRLQYFDKKLGDEFNILFKDIDARFDSISFPFGPSTSKFRLFADIRNNKSQNATLNVNGYIKMNDKSLKAKLSLEDLDVHILEPLYNRYLAGLVKEGILNFYSRIETQNQTLKADCRLNIERASFAKDIKVSPEDNLIAEFLLAMNLEDFTIKISNVRGNIFEILFDKVLTAQKSNTTNQGTN